MICFLKKQSRADEADAGQASVEEMSITKAKLREVLKETELAGKMRHRQKTNKRIL